MTKYITHLEVSSNDTEQQSFLAQGYKKIGVNLNQQTGGNEIYLWYKKASGSASITRIQFTFNDQMDPGLISVGYNRINKNLNEGSCGDDIYLWYFYGNTEYDIPIIEIDITTDAKQEGRKFTFGWERLACDLNRHAGGDWIHAWVKREKQTYICDVTATDSNTLDRDLFEEGFIRVDEDTNKGACGGSMVFIWYRQSTDSKRALTDLSISTTNDEFQSLQQQGYRASSVNLNAGTSGDMVFLWWMKREGFNPIRAMSLIANQEAQKPLQEAGVKIIERNLNTGNECAKDLYLCYYQ